MPSSIDAVVAIGVDLAEKCCDVEFVAVDCVVFVAVAADELDFVPEFDLAVAEHFELLLEFGFVGLIPLLHVERCAIEYAFVSGPCDRNLNQSLSKEVIYNKTIFGFLEHQLNV